MKRNPEFPAWQCIGQPRPGRFGGVFYNQHRKFLIHECVTGKRWITDDDVQDQL
jgi:hypothetical protein